VAGRLLNWARVTGRGPKKNLVRKPKERDGRTGQKEVSFGGLRKAGRERNSVYVRRRRAAVEKKKHLEFRESRVNDKCSSKRIWGRDHRPVGGYKGEDLTRKDS